MKAGGVRHWAFFGSTGSFIPPMRRLRLRPDEPPFVRTLSPKNTLALGGEIGKPKIVRRAKLGDATSSTALGHFKEPESNTFPDRRPNCMPMNAIGMELIIGHC